MNILKMNKYMNERSSCAAIELSLECCTIFKVRPALCCAEVNRVLGLIIIIIKNHRGKISIEFPESTNLEKSYFNLLLRAVRHSLAAGLGENPKSCV